MEIQRRKKQPTKITWIARGSAAFIGAGCLIVLALYPAGADFDDTNALLSTLLIAALVGAGLLYIGERDKR